MTRDPNGPPASLDAARMRAVLDGHPQQPERDPSGPAPITTILGVKPAELVAIFRRELGSLCDLRDEVMTQAQVAELLHYNPKTVHRLTKEEGLPMVRVGNQKRFLRSQVIEWVKANAATVPDRTLKGA